MKINLDDIEVEIIYEYKPLNKGVYFSYKGNHTFKINSGYRYNEKNLVKLILANKDKMLKILNRYEDKNQPINTMHYLGKMYYIEIEESNYNMVFLVDDKMVVKHKKNASIEKIIKSFYIEGIKNYTDMVFDSIFEKFSDLNIKRPTLKYKYTKTFYGKCFPKENMIEMSGMCMKMDKKYIDCVIMHELCHFKYLNHQDGFYNYFESKLKGCKKIQHEFRSLKYQDIY